MELPRIIRLASYNFNDSGSRFNPQPQRLMIFHLNLGQEVTKETCFPLVRGAMSSRLQRGSGFGPDQVLLSKNFRSRPGSRLKSLLRKSGVGVGVKIWSSMMIFYKHSVLTKLGFLWVQVMGRTVILQGKRLLSFRSGPLSFKNGLSGPLRLGAQAVGTFKVRRLGGF